MTKARKPRLWLAFAVSAACLIAIGGTPLEANAVEVENLYTVTVPYDRRANDAERQSNELALAQVLLRITGSDTEARAADIRDLFPDPRRYVLRWRPGSDGTRVVSLDGPAIEAVLRQAGLPVWGSDRPLTLVWLAVDWGQGNRTIVASDEAIVSSDVLGAGDQTESEPLRERVLAAAERRGLPMLFPLLDSEDLAQVSFSDIWGGFDETLLTASRRYGAQAVLVGRVRAGSIASTRWSYYSAAQRLEWSGPPEDVLGELADVFAQQFAYSGSARVESVRLTVSGVDTVTGYGRVQQLLDSLNVIDGYRLDTVNGADLRYVVDVQGGSERLATALEFSGVLRRADWLGVQDFVGVGVRDDALEYLYQPDPQGMGLEQGPDDDMQSAGELK